MQFRTTVIERTGRMIKKGGKIVFQEEIDNDEDWARMLRNLGVYVVDVYTEICGPCIPMVANLKKVKMDLGAETLHYAIAMSDNITALKRFRGKSEPHWMFFFDGRMVNLMIGADAPRLMKLITDEVEQYHMFKNGEIQRNFMPVDKITDEERTNTIETERYLQQKMRIQNKIKDQKKIKRREHALRTFLPNVPLKTCVVFFPHTVKYLMVEKPRNENESANPSGPVMVEKRVCEVANSCALKYEELVVVEARDIELTEDALNEMFFSDAEILKSFPPPLVEELLTRRVYTVLLSLPETKTDSDESVSNDTHAKPVNAMGVIEQKVCTIIYGNGDPLNPSTDSIAYKNTTVNEAGEKIPSLYTPTNPLSKASALTVLFKKFCANNGYVVPQMPLPQYLVKFEVDKSNIVLPIVKDLEEKIVQYGFFYNANSENPRLLSKDFKLMITYGLDNFGKDVMLVLSVLWDDGDKSLLRFAGFEPTYMSPNYEAGVNDADKFFPYDFDQMDGELNVWLESNLDGEGEDEVELPAEHYAVEEEQQSSD